MQLTEFLLNHINSLSCTLPPLSPLIINTGLPSKKNKMSKILKRIVNNKSVEIKGKQNDVTEIKKFTDFS